MFLSHGDYIFPLDAALYWLKHLFVWSYQNGATNLDGIIRLPGKLLNLLVFSAFGNVAVSYFYIAISLLLVFAAFYYFAWRFLRIENRALLITGSLIFTFNPIFLGNLAKLGLVAAAAMLPLCLALLHQAFQRRKFSYFIWFLFALNFSLIHPFTFTINLVISGVYLIWQMVRHREFVKQHVLKFVGIAGVAVLLNLYFILPILTLGTISKTALSQEISERPVDYTRLVEIANTGDIFTALALSKNVLIDFAFHAPWYESIYFVAVFGLYLLLLGVFVYVQRRLSRKTKLEFLLFLGSYIALILLSTATFLHVDDLIKFLIGLPGGWMFRSPLKWQLYIPFVLFGAILLLVRYVKDRRITWAISGALLLITVMANAYVVGDITNKLLTPRTFKYFTAMQQTDMSQQVMLFVASSECTDFARENSDVMTELNQVLIAKDLQVKRIDVPHLDTVLLTDYDYVLNCKVDTIQQGDMMQDFTMQHTFVDGTFALYQNQRPLDGVVAFDKLYALDSTRDIHKKQAFAQQALGGSFWFAHEQQYRSPAIGLNNVFEEIVPQHVTPGKVSASVLPNAAGTQQLFVRHGNEPLFYQHQQNKVVFSPQPFDQAQTLSAQEPYGRLDIPTPADTPIEVEYMDTRYSATNLLPNPSFEEGLWKDEVGDCNAYDNRPSISMLSTHAEKTDGQQALQLQATRHIACTNPDDIAIKPGATYLLSFDYRSDKPDRGGFFVSYDNSPQDSLMSERLPEGGSDWHTLSRVFTVPADATKLTLFLYAFPDELMGVSARVLYDNFRLVEMPDLQDRFYVLHDPAQALRTPREIAYKTINPTKKTLTVSGATSPFYLAIKDSYHAQWQLSTAATAVPNDQHFRLNNFMNGWYIDPAALCQGSGQCTHNSDGSYSIELVAEFTPQRWFAIGGVVSGLAFTGCIGYLVYDWRRSRRVKGRP